MKIKLYNNIKYVSPMSNIKQNDTTSNTVFNRIIHTTNEYRATRSNFPTAGELKSQLYEKHFNRCLDIVYKKIQEANESPGNPTTIRVLNTDFNSISVPTTVPGPVSQCVHIPENVVVELKKFLVDKGYTIVETEDPVGVSIGWRLSW